MFPKAELVKEYIDVVISWPTAIIVLGIIFLFRFSNSIRFFLENIRSFRAGPVEVSQFQQLETTAKIDQSITENLKEQGVTITGEQMDQINKAIDEKDQTISFQQNQLKYLVERAEQYEFAYLNQILVPHTKLALLWFNNQSAHASTKENFFSQYQLPKFINDIAGEREAIFNAFLVNELLEATGGIYRLTEKGERFLRFIGLLK